MLRRSCHAAILLSLIISLFISSAKAEEKSEASKAKPETIEAWRQLKFGLFIHWGPVSLKGTEIGWSRMCPRTPWTKWKFKGSVPVEEYDNLYKKFNPEKFDAEEWVQIAKDAGMRYLVFTTKHHDGFCNFDSKWTDYKITSP
ncbi:MAG: alpha-L-fucosidase, partial [Planctomycetia bacterium]